MERQSVFCFEDPKLPSAPALIAEIPSGLNTNTALLEALAKALRFPDYCGANLDALDECLCDLSWLPSGAVVLRHSDLPNMNDAYSASYLAILSGAVRELSEAGTHTLLVVFPSQSRQRIAELLQPRDVG